jgi:hypothetical protein
VGKAGEQNSWESDGAVGSLFYGPYLHLSPGRYYARLKLYKLRDASDSAEFWLGVTSNKGSNTILGLQMACTGISHNVTTVFLEFPLDEAAEVEVLGRVTPESRIGIRELIIFRKDS